MATTYLWFREGQRENRQRAYPNLQRRNEVREHYRTVADFVARNVPNSWHVIDDGTDQLSIIRHWEFNEQRGTVEFRVMNKKAEELSLQVKAHGCSVNLKKDLGLKRILNSMPMEKQILLAIKFIESSSLCFGFQVEQGENVMTLLPSYLRSLIKNNEAKECQRIFAENCLVLATSTEICPNCASSIGDGGSSAFLRNCAVTKAIPYTTFPFNGKLNGSIKWFPHFALTFLRSYFCARILKLYVLLIKSAFKYSHQLNRNESSNGFHILRSHFKFTYSVAFSENYGIVTF